MSFLFVDKITHLIPGELIRGIKYVRSDDYYLTNDEQGNPCFITSLIGEALGQLAAWNVMSTNNFTHRPVAGVVARACLYRPAYLNETILLESVIENLDSSAVQYHSNAYVNDEVIFSVEGALGPLLPMQEFIDIAQARYQFSTINNSITNCQSAAVSCLPKTISLMFDRVTFSEPGLSIHAVTIVNADAPYFSDHFPHKPVLPMTVLLECKINLAKLFLQQAGWQSTYIIHELRKIKMSDFVKPGDTLNCYATVHAHNEQQLILRFRSEIDTKRVCVLEMVLLKRARNYE